MPTRMVFKACAVSTGGPLVGAAMRWVALLLDESHANLLRGVPQARYEPLDRRAVRHGGGGKAHRNRREHPVLDHDGHGHRHLLGDTPAADGGCVALLARLIEDLLHLRTAASELVLLALGA